MDKTEAVFLEMTAYEAGCPSRIQHFIKVYQFARIIGRMEGLAPETQQILELVALVHDIGIRPAEEKYNSSQGHYQELEGPPAAEALLGRLGISREIIRRVSYLVGHHHTYTHIDGQDYQILVEADFLVNLFEGNSGLEAQKSVYRSVFHTEGGKRLFQRLYPAAAEDCAEGDKRK